MINKRRIPFIIIILILLCIVIYEYYIIQKLEFKVNKMKKERNLLLKINKINKLKGINDIEIYYDKIKFDFKNIENYWIEKFYEIGNKHGTDKVTWHNYHHLFGKYIGPLRHIDGVNFLEIGLGCGMGYGPGRSLLTWREYLPKAKITYMEYDEICGETFRNKVDNLYIGDQSNFEDLKRVGDGSGPFDAIVDDGGHSRKQQINSLIGLWPYLKSGGVYIIEDIMYSFVKELNDNHDSIYDVITKFLILFNDPSPFPYTNISPIVNIQSELKSLSEQILSINCFRRVCAFIKK